MVTTDVLLRGTDRLFFNCIFPLPFIPAYPLSPPPTPTLSL